MDADQFLARLHCRMALLDQIGKRKKKPRLSKVKTEGNFISFFPDDKREVGQYIAAEPLKPSCNYFEIELTDTENTGDIIIGLVSYLHPLEQFPGWWRDSVGYHSKNGKIYKGVPRSSIVGPRCSLGDVMGCGIKYENSHSNQKRSAVIFFTRNRKEVATTEIPFPKDGLYPAVCFYLECAEVLISLDASWKHDDDTLMCIDSNEEEWFRLHDIRLNGMVLEYAGRGKSIIDVGLAQARYPLDTTHHYFEIEIIDPGESCYIAIGLARRDYPKSRHPGWNRGSIAYHADDGKIFVGSGTGAPFGPQCHKGDRMGCGIIFPRDFVNILEFDDPTYMYSEINDELLESLSDSDDEERLLEKQANIETGITVQVFFTRNRQTIGQKDVCIPKGGFYPTVGMLSSDEKVKVDLHPLTG